MARTTNKPEISLGLDFDEKSVKFVLLRESSSGANLLAWGIREVVPQMAELNDKPTAISRTIKELLQENKLKPENIHTAVSGPAVIIRRLTLPSMPEKELKEAIRWESRNFVPFPLETIILDFHVLGKLPGEKLDLIVVATQEELIKNHLAILHQASLTTTTITTVPFALWDLVENLPQLKSAESIALIDIGAESSCINLYKENNLQFTREISVAGETISNALTGLIISEQWQMNLSPEQAEKYIRAYGMPKADTTEMTDDGIPLNQLLEIMSPILKRLVSEIARSLDYYKEQFHELGIERIILSGGGAKLKNFSEHLTRELGIEVEPLNPFSAITIDPSVANVPALKENIPRLNLALGLALGRGEKINFLRTKRFATEKARTELEDLGGIPAAQFPVAQTVTLIVAILMLGCLYFLSLNWQIGRLQKEVKEKGELSKGLKSISEQREVLSLYRKQKPQTREILTLLSDITPKNISFGLLNYVDRSRLINLSGEAPDAKRVGEYLRALDQSPFFSQVTLVDIKRSSREGPYQVEFKVNFHVDQ